MTIFSLAAVFTASIAWFTTVRKQDSNGSDIVIQDPKLIESNALRPFYTGVSLSNTELAFNMKQISSELGYYSPLDGKGYQRVLEIDLTDYASQVAESGDSNLTLSATTTADHYLAETDPSTGRLYDLVQEEHNPLSSVVNFTYFTKADMIDRDERSGWFIIDTEQLADRTQSFVNSSKTLDKTIRIQEDISLNDTDNGIFYILIDYDVMQINEIYAANLGNPVCSGQVEYVQYDYDFSFSLFERHKGESN